MGLDDADFEVGKLALNKFVTFNASMFLRRYPRNQCYKHAEHVCSTCCISEIKFVIFFLRNLRYLPEGPYPAPANTHHINI